jgi:PIN domain nuclease of toxin-antitoxin system
VPSVREWVEQAEDGVFVSRASLWELAITISLGKLRLDLPKFVRQAERDGFFWLSIDTRHLLAVAELPTFNDHKDPFDRLLVAQSMTEPLILLTTDGNMSRYGSTVRVV